MLTLVDFIGEGVAGQHIEKRARRDKMNVSMQGVCKKKKSVLILALI